MRVSARRRSPVLLRRSIRRRRAELIAATHSVEEIRKYIDADSLGYLSLEGMLRVRGGPSTQVCTACWTDELPGEPPAGRAREQLRLLDKTRR